MTSALSVYTMISAADTTGVEEFSTLFAYEGFNPEMIHSHFAKIMTEKGIGEMEFVNDMRALITLGAMKGNYTMKNAGKISEAGRTKADGLYKKYNMKQGSLGGDKKAVILPRVLSAFPELTTKVVLRTPPRDFGTRTTRLPKYIKNPVFPSLVPKTLQGDVAKTFLWLYTVYSAEQSLVISQEKDFNAAFTAQKQFVTIAFNSSVPDETTRIGMFKAKLEDLVQAISDFKDFTDGEVPTNRSDARVARDAITTL
ncbi:nucleocapsid [Laurel Lake virus]|uniref:Nucleoprotein n=1 Tax=Laurel Lake virus TaxID=2027354 RepID=A0A223PQZ2_9VIRU|nr:nucleocapsid [Laurel Lake virus]ASU47550.1 nucleocapsid [Laurel Lake virus]